MDTDIFKLNEKESASVQSHNQYFKAYWWLWKDAEYADLDICAKLLYCFLSARAEMSCRKNWVDEDGKVFIICRISEMVDFLGVGKDKVNRLLNELKEHNLLLSKQMGFSNPNRLYVLKPSNKAIEEYHPWVSKYPLCASYFTAYENRLEKKHPYIKQEYLSSCEAKMQDMGLNEDCVSDMANAFFDSPMETDYNILHFCSDGVLENRLYETVY